MALKKHHWGPEQKMGRVAAFHEMITTPIMSSSERVAELWGGHSVLRRPLGTLGTLGFIVVYK